MAQEEVQVSIDDRHLREFRQVVQRLAKAGLHVEQELEEIGVVTGHADADQVDRIAQVAGVAHVERSRTVSIPPGEMSR